MIFRVKKWKYIEWKENHRNPVTYEKIIHVQTKTTLQNDVGRSVFLQKNLQGVTFYHIRTHGAQHAPKDVWDQDSSPQKCCSLLFPKYENIKQEWQEIHSGGSIKNIEELIADSINPGENI